MNWNVPPKPAEVSENRLIQAILQGQFPIDSYLPAERELAGMLGISVSGVSAHLRRLREAKLVSCRRDGQTVCCALASGSRHIRALRTMFREITEETGCC